MWFKNLERAYLNYLICVKSVYFDFLFGLAVDVIRISIWCGVDIQQWRSGGKNIILKAQSCLLTGTMTWFLRRELDDCSWRSSHTRTRASSKSINPWSYQNGTDCWCNIQSQG